MIVTNVQ
jgi:hypothetical protein